MIRTFGVGKQLVQLLDAVPAGSTVINTSSKSTVWLGGDPGTAVGIGFPLRPLASMEKPNVGPLYAILDSAATELAVTILVGDDLSGYSDPIALATAVATQLALSGIPNVLTETTIVANDPILAGQAKTYAISSYASIVIFQDNLTLTTDLFLEQLDPSGNVVDTFQVVSLNAVRFAVTGTLVRITNGASSTINVTMTGSNRVAQARFDSRAGDTMGDFWSLPSTVWVVGVSQTLNQNATNTMLQGLVHLNAQMTGTVTGRFELITGQPGNTFNTHILADTAEMFTGASGARQVSKLVAIPACSYFINFRPLGTPGSSTPVLTMMSANIS